MKYLLALLIAVASIVPAQAQVYGGFGYRWTPRYYYPVYRPYYRPYRRAYRPRYYRNYYGYWANQGAIAFELQLLNDNLFYDSLFRGK